MITLNQIRNFLTLGKELHFAKAAEKLHISQAALSSDIRKLETEIQTVLFDRSDKWNIRMTSAGNAFYEKICGLPSMIEEAKTAAFRAARGETGEISIMVLPSVYNHINLNDIFRKMLSHFPDVKMKISDSPSGVSMEALKNSACDIAFLTFSGTVKKIPGLKFRKIFKTPLAFAIPKNHRLASKPEITLEDFKDCGFIMPPQNESHWFSDIREDIFLKYGHFEPKIVQEARGPLSTMNLVAAGFGIGILTESFHNSFPNLIVLRRIPAPAERTIIAAWLENNTSPALKNFVSLLDELQKKKQD